MAKKKKSIESILANGEKFFKRGNFLLAQKEFEKVQKKLQRDDIAEKIKICQRENRAVKAKELVKKGYKTLGKGDLQGALNRFKESVALQELPEARLLEKIASLENELLAGCADEDASKAEADGDFAGAAELYAVAAEKMDDPTILLKKASCLVRAGEWAGALQDFSLFADQEGALQGYEERFVYDYGFALAKNGCYTRALNIWNSLLDTDKGFLQQKRDVFTLAVHGLCKNIEEFGGEPDENLKLSDQSLELSSQFGQFSAQADELYELSMDLGNHSQQQLLEKIVKYLKYQLLAAAWNMEDYKTVSLILEQVGGSDDHLTLSLKAKTAFHLSKNDPSNLKNMVAYWLTALYSMEISTSFSSDPAQREKIQNKLIKLAESVANSHVDTVEGKFALKALKLEKRLIADLLKIVRKSGVEEKNCAELICTPRYASLFNLSEKVLNLVELNREFFNDVPHCLETGGYYCRAWQSLYLMKTGDMDKAMEHLDSLPRESFGDEFSRYVKMLVNFEYGKTAIDRGKKAFLKFFDETHLLFEIHPALEKEFTEFIHEFHEVEALQKYEQLLSLLYTRNSSENLAKPLSFVMIQSGIARSSKGILQNRALKVVAENALDLDPANEYAHEVLNSIEIREEVEEMMLSMSKRKFAKASKIVNTSRHLEVEEQYFEMIDSYVDQCEGGGYEDSEFVLVLLQEMYDWAITVDPQHPVVGRMRMMIDMRS